MLEKWYRITHCRGGFGRKVRLEPGVVITDVCDRWRWHLGAHSTSVGGFKRAAEYWEARRA
jgi:hypothetical protein